MAPLPTEAGIPVLTDVIVPASPILPPLGEPRDALLASDALVAELQTKLSSRAFALTEDLLRDALAGVQAALFEEITARLRRDLPEIIDATLREHLGSDDPS